MHVWRIAREAYQGLDGEGARINGGRWNSGGVAVVYTSVTLALAALEYLVHVDPEDVPADLFSMRIEVPDDLRQVAVAVSSLPLGWREMPDHPGCVKLGDRWVEERWSSVLLVPSAIVPEEANLLINPNHPEAARIEVDYVRPFAFDPRLLG